ncbi:helix-turn-helix domain-containing protein (plasmid) [Sulfurospirillum sp. 'SP']|nr:helix-turn-helix domain-containing protein [Sulfurospirillum sp. 'SP']WNZ00458.1 helix-turn-helix domain-containing protein [Sulfurospirillum sp. 'SP']
MKVVRKMNRPDHVNITSSKALGHWIRYQRTALGLTQQAAAILCNLNTQTFAKIEKGHPLVGLDNALKVAMTLGLQLSIHVKGEL